MCTTYYIMSGAIYKWNYKMDPLHDSIHYSMFTYVFHVQMSNKHQQTDFFLTTFMDFDDWRSYSAGHQKVIMLPIFPINCESVPSCRDDDDRLVDVFVTAKTSAEAIG